ELRSRVTELDILFRNLIDNAVKYGGNPPLVMVVASLVGGNRVMVRVSDNGPGIPPNLRRKIFGRFVRLGSELERSKPGTGLGLYLVRTVTRSLGGSIQIDDREQQQGTSFTVTLPGVIPAASDEEIASEYERSEVARQ
ncbi:MAG: sensor histidine kinase, partial [Planctomycetaceae bacterium]